MRKLCLFIATCTALVVFLGFSTPAFAISDPHCNNEPALGHPGHNNQTAIFDFTADTPLSHEAGAASNLTARAYTCGTNFPELIPGGDDSDLVTMYHHADVLLPPGVTVTDTNPGSGDPNSPAIGSFSGKGVSNAIGCVLGWLGMACSFYPDEASKATTDNKESCDAQRDAIRSFNHETPVGTTVACFRSQGSQGGGWSWATRETSGERRLWFTIGPIVPGDTSLRGGFTYVNLELCKFFGGPNPDYNTPCPSSGQKVQWKNGSDSTGSDGCVNSNGPKGRLTMYATMRGGTRRSATACIRWTQPEPPNTILLQQPQPPPAYHNNPRPSFAFASSPAGAQFQCKFDAASNFPNWSNCSSPYTPSTDLSPNGDRTFSVRACNNPSDVSTCDQTPAEHSWFLDTIRPTATITSRPANPSDDNTPSFGFNVNDPAPSSGINSVVCKLTGPSGGHDYRTCDSNSEENYTTSLLDGNYEFCVKATDRAGNEGVSACYAWTINTTPINHPPTCDNFSQNIPHNPPNTTGTDINLSRYCRDPDAGQTQTLTYGIVSGPNNGSTPPPTPAGIVRYTPNSGFQGSDWFTFKACDVNGACSNDGGQPSARASLTVQAPDNNPPICPTSISRTVQQGVLVNILQGNRCTDPDPGDSVSYYTITRDARNGVAGYEPFGQEVTYRSGSTYEGQDDFAFEACDTHGVCSEPNTEVNITVTGGPNPLPACQTFNETVDRGGSVNIQLRCTDNDLLQYSPLSQPTQGTLGVPNSSGLVPYVHNAGANGIHGDSFTYRACERNRPSACSGTETVNITVRNNPPVCEDIDVAVSYEAPKTIPLARACSDRDGQEIGFYNFGRPWLDGPDHGDTTPYNGNETGEATYRPRNGYAGPDSFEFRAWDGRNNSNGGTASTVNLNVEPPPVEPDCDSGPPWNGDGPFNNVFAVNGFNVDTTNSNAGEESAMTIEGVLCGTEIRANPNECGASGRIPPQGRETLNDHADIVYAPGVDVNTTQDYGQPYGDKIPVNSLVGKARINVALCAQNGNAGIVEDLFADIKVFSWGLCFSERGTALAGNPVFGFMPTCYRGVIPGIGYFYAWVNNPNPDPSQGRNTLTIGPLHGVLPGSLGVDAGITNIKEFTLCARAGIVGATTCADDSDTSRPWVQKNGDRSTTDCRGGNGIYQIKVTNKGDRNALPPIPARVTNPVEDCVRWQSRLTANEHCMDEYNNVPGIKEFGLRTVNNYDNPELREHTIANVRGSGYFCGSYLGPNPGDGDNTLSNHADMTLPPGVEVADSDVVGLSSYAGSALTSILWRNSSTGLPEQRDRLMSRTFTAPKTACAYQRDNEVVGDTPGRGGGTANIRLCLHGVNAQGDNWNWVTRVGQWRDGRPKYTLTIGPMWNPRYEYDPDQRAKVGLTYIEIELCGYFGAVFTVGCGDPNGPGGPTPTPLMKNGDASAPNCNGGAGPNGLHTITATMWGGAVAPSATTCIPWTSTTVVDPECDLGLPGGDGPYNNDFRIRRFTAAVQPGGEREYSTLNTSGVICGTAIGPYTGGVGPYGWQTLTSRLDLKLAPEEVIAPLAANDPSYVLNDAYAGQISGRMAVGNASGTSISPFQAKLKVVIPAAGDCPQESRLVACFKAEILEPNPDMSGNFYVWAMNGLDLGDWYRQTLMVGRLRNTDTPPFPGGPLIGAGLTAFDLTVCRYGGTANASVCPATPLPRPGQTEGWLHRNGVRCSRLTAQARNWFARTTPAVETLEEGSSGGPTQLCPTKIGAIIKLPRWPDMGTNRPRTGGK